ncbi:MaoC/PaaZ C-terminal domain-containing protein [Aeromicrobium sp.]|uniref:MaoC/PaaZ C-terminal domain-containing protein n=1 Tax=Aeromicrobium sp. TaxID=1871063 RepID=UPI0030C10253
MTDQASGVRFVSEAIGRWSDPETFEVTRERIAEYAAATNDPIEAHLAGDVASPVFAIVPVFMGMIGAAFTVAPPEVAMRVVHGKQDFHLRRPIRPGDTLTSRVKPLGYSGAANGTTLAFVLETRDAEDQIVNEQYMTAFFRGIDVGESVGELAPPHTFDEALREQEPVATVTAHVDGDQTFRYSPASGDPMPIHLDEEAALAAGLPGIINHGLCTQAFTSWAVVREVAGGDSSRLKRLAVRFAKPVLPGQDVTTTIWKSRAADGLTTYAFESTVDGVVVIKDGLAVVAD